MRLILIIPFLAVCLMLPVYTSAQHTYTVVDKESHNPLPYAIIVFGENDSQSYMSTNEEGVFQIVGKPNINRIIVHNIGYESISVNVADIRDTIFLLQKDKTLEEVIIHADNPEKTVSKIHKKNNVRLASNTAGFQHVTRLFFNKEDSGVYKKINAVGLRMKINPDANPCRLLLYEQDADGKPGKELLGKSIIITKDRIRHRIAEIDLSKEDIFTNSDAVFVGVEYIGKIFRKEGVVVSDTIDYKDRSVVYMTLSEAKADTYLRLVYQHEWYLLGDAVKGDYPYNLMVYVTYE